MTDQLWTPENNTKWEPPAELWALLRPEIVAIARDECSFMQPEWLGFTEAIPTLHIDWWKPYSKSDCYILSALNLPNIPAAESLFIRPGRE